MIQDPLPLNCEIPGLDHSRSFKIPCLSSSLIIPAEAKEIVFPLIGLDGLEVEKSTSPIFIWEPYLPKEVCKRCGPGSSFLVGMDAMTQENNPSVYFAEEGEVLMFKSFHFLKS